ncbi:MAG: sugar transferase [Acidimicrobiales bacterium]
MSDNAPVVTADLHQPPRSARAPMSLVREPAPLGSDRYGPFGRVAKRGIDLVLSALLLVALLPVLVVIGLVVRSTSPGPALFRQTRIGYKEQPFTIYKFRTMATDNDPDEHRQFVQAMLRGQIPTVADDGRELPEGRRETVFKLVDDPRVTPLGEWLRANSLDELPQLLNVLRGEMSLVGPRPTLDYEVSEYQPHHRRRASSMPGMTGLWQVGGRSDLHMTEALDLDVVYVETCSLRGDLGILARTLKVVVRGTGV